MLRGGIWEADSHRKATIYRGLGYTGKLPETKACKFWVLGDDGR